MNMEQKVNDDWLEADHRRLDYRNFMDDEEVTLLHHKRDTDVPDNPVSDVHDGPDTSDTQREDRLLQTEPLHGARPRRTERERPPLIDDRAGVLDLEAAGVRGPEGGATWNSCPSAVTQVADLTGGGSDYTTEGGGSGSRDSGAARWGASRASDFTEVCPRDGGPD